MKDVWIRANLSTIFSGNVPALTTISERLKKAKFEADVVVGRVAEKGLAMSYGLEVTANFLDELTQTGANMLLMPPQAKPFHTRVAEAENKPTNDKWTAGIVIFIQGPSVQDTLKSYNALLDIIQKPIPIEDLINALTT